MINLSEWELKHRSLVAYIMIVAVIAGVGVGWSEAEYDALGFDFANRGRRLDEILRLWRSIWTDDPVSFDGEFVQFEPLWSWPKPVAHAGPPCLSVPLITTSSTLSALACSNRAVGRLWMSIFMRRVQHEAGSPASVPIAM